MHFFVKSDAAYAYDSLHFVILEEGSNALQPFCFATQLPSSYTHL